MAEAADAETVYNIVSKQYGHECTITLENGVVKLRNGWSRGADIQMMAGGSMQGPDEKVFIVQKSYLDEKSARIIKKSAGFCAVLGVVGFWFLFSGADVISAMQTGPTKFGMSSRQMGNVASSAIYCIVGGGLLVGSAVGWIAAYIVTSQLNTRDHRRQNKVWTDALRGFVNKNV